MTQSRVVSVPSTSKAATTGRASAGAGTSRTRLYTRSVSDGPEIFDDLYLGLQAGGALRKQRRGEELTEEERERSAAGSGCRCGARRSPWAPSRSARSVSASRSAASSSAAAPARPDALWPWRRCGVRRRPRLTSPRARARPGTAASSVPRAGARRRRRAVEREDDSKLAHRVVDQAADGHDHGAVPLVLARRERRMQIAGSADQRLREVIATPRSDCSHGSSTDSRYAVNPSVGRFSSVGKGRGGPSHDARASPPRPPRTVAATTIRIAAPSVTEGS